MLVCFEATSIYMVFLVSKLTYGILVFSPGLCPGS